MNTYCARANQAISLARRESDRFNHNYVGCEHLLLAILIVEAQSSVSVFRESGQNLEVIRRLTVAQMGTGLESRLVGNIPFTPRIKRIFEKAGKEARALEDTYVGTEHFLLAFMAEGESIPASVLKNMGLTYDLIKEIYLTRIRGVIAVNTEPDGPPASDADFRALYEREKFLRLAAENRATGFEVKVHTLRAFAERLLQGVANAYASGTADELRRIQAM